MTEENIPFEQRWSQLLEETRARLTHLDKDDKEGQIRSLWTDINRFVTIMAVPKQVMPQARKTLARMACKAPLKLTVPLLIYALMMLLPRRWYRNVSAQHWFKQRLGAIVPESSQTKK